MPHALDLFQGLWVQHPWAIVFSLAGYIAVVRLLRYRRVKTIDAPFAHGQRKLSSMTSEEAHAIISQLQEFEFPHAFNKARKIALLKVRQSLPLATPNLYLPSKPLYQAVYTCN